MAEDPFDEFGRIRPGVEERLRHLMEEPIQPPAPPFEAFRPLVPPPLIPVNVSSRNRPKLRQRSRQATRLENLGAQVLEAWGCSRFLLWFPAFFSLLLASLSLNSFLLWRIWLFFQLRPG